MKKIIAVLALQGAFSEHEKMLERLDTDYFEIRQKRDAERHFDGLIIPGGESTVQGKLIKDLGLYDILDKKIAEGLPVMGTCAGMILLAESIENDTNRYFAAMPITVKRNAYGRQLGSFYTESRFCGKTVPMTFIRAPYITDKGKSEILSEVGGKAVAARYRNMIAVSFHPELNEETFVHEYFLDMVRNR